MDDVESLAKQIIDKVEDTGAYWSVGKESRSTLDKPFYYVNIIFTKSQLPPMQSNSFSINELKDDLKKQLDKIDSKTLAVRYHEVQIEANEASIKYHRDMIKGYKSKGRGKPKA